MIDQELFKVITAVKTLAILVIVYFPSVSLSGYLQACFAEKLGDTTAREHGFKTIDPVVHTNPLGLIIFLLSPFFYGIAFGWGTRVPLSPQDIEGNYASLKKVLLFFSSALIYTGLVFILLILAALFIVLFKGAILSSVLIVTIFQYAIVFNTNLIVLGLIFGALEFLFTEVLHETNLLDQYGAWLYLVAILIASFFVFSYLSNYVVWFLFIIFNVLIQLFSRLIG